MPKAPKSSHPRRVWTHFEEGIAMALLALLCLTVAGQVFSRFVLRDPFVWAEEVARLLFIWTAFMGAVLAFKQNRHFAIELLAERMSAGGRFWQRSALWIRRAAAVLVIALLLMLMWYGVAYCWDVHGTRTAILEISLLWSYLPLPLACLLMVRHALQVLLSLRLPLASSPINPGVGE